MRYFYARWFHNNPDYPTEFYSEIDEERYETRKIELYADGRFGIATNSLQIGDTQLGEVPVPLLEEINGQAEFEAVAIIEEQFEEQWVRYSS